MILKKELIQREIAGDTILVPVGKSVLDSNGLFVLNGSGAFLWAHLPEAETPQALTEALLAEYEVDEATARADVEEFLTSLRKLGIID